MPKGIYKRTEEAKKNMSVAHKGKKPNNALEIFRLNGGKTKGSTGLPAWNKGKKLHYKVWNKGLECSKEVKLKISQANKGKTSGEKNYRWIKDRTLIKHQLERNNPNDKQWKYNVYKRDGFKCKINNKDCSGRIEAHHILGWKDYPELRCEINNGITLCHAHHPKKRAEEKRLFPYFMELVSVSKE